MKGSCDTVEAHSCIDIVTKFTDEQYTTQLTAGRFDPRVFVNCLRVEKQRLMCWCCLLCRRASDLPEDSLAIQYTRQRVEGRERLTRTTLLDLGLAQGKAAVRCVPVSPCRCMHCGVCLCIHVFCFAFVGSVHICVCVRASVVGCVCLYSTVCVHVCLWSTVCVHVCVCSLLYVCMCVCVY